MQLTDWVSRFVVAKRQEGLSLRTIEQYSWHLARLVSWLAERNIHTLDGLSRDLLREWGAALRDGWLPATCKQAVAAVRSFLAWCAEEGVCDAALRDALRVPRVPARVQRAISGEECGRLLAACDVSAARGVRDVALLNVLIDTGLRAAEVCRVRVVDVDLLGRLLLVVVKGGQQAVAGFGASTAAALARWLAVRVVAPGVGTLFVSVGGLTPGRPLTVSGLRRILRRVGDRAGVARVSTHAFRRGMAVIATDAGAPSRMVQLAGRWSDIRMVERYTASMRGLGLYERWSPADCVNGDALDVKP